MIWEYGICKSVPARRHKIKKNVQFVLWKAGTQGYKEDYWHDFDSSWWDGFHPHRTTENVRFRWLKAIFTQIAKATSYISKRCTQCLVNHIIGGCLV